MRIKEGFVLRSINKDHVVIGEGLAQVNFDMLVTLNGSGTYLWEQVTGKDFTVQDLANLLQSRYEVDAQTATADAGAWARKLLDNGLLEP